MIKLLEDFHGEMSESSIGATVYSYWQYFFYDSLLQQYTNKGKKESKYRTKEEDENDADKEVIKQFW